MTTPKATVPGALHRWVKVVNKKGVHARAAAKFVKAASRFNADIQVGHGGLVVPGTSIMGIMLLAAARGTTLEIGASGEDAERALDELEQLVAEGFEEP
ncbi:MAG: HPr family phosphocarrier protein [Geminicoccaceae bacterium]